MKASALSVLAKENYVLDVAYQDSTARLAVFLKKKVYRSPHFPALLWLAILIVALVFFYVLLTLLSALRKVQQTERKEFFVCERHGPVPVKGGTITLSAEQSGLGQPVIQCVLCFENSFKEADKAMKQWIAPFKP